MKFMLESLGYVDKRCIVYILKINSRGNMINVIFLKIGKIWLI